jgi:hypothetical protein
MEQAREKYLKGPSNHAHASAVWPAFVDKVPEMGLTKNMDQVFRITERMVTGCDEFLRW